MHLKKVNNIEAIHACFFPASFVPRNKVINKSKLKEFPYFAVAAQIQVGFMHYTTKSCGFCRITLDCVLLSLLNSLTWASIITKPSGSRNMTEHLLIL